MEESFNNIYFKGEVYQINSQVLDQANQSTISNHMNKFMNLYLQKVHLQMQLYKCDTEEQCHYYVEQLNKYLQQFCAAGNEFNNYKKFSLNFNWSEYHKQNFITRILYDSKIYDTIMTIKDNYQSEGIEKLVNLIKSNKNNKIEYCCDLVYQEQTIQIKTHSDLMRYWIQYSQCEDLGLDEIMDFERRLEKAITGLPETEKQLPTIPLNWEQQILSKKK
ncbi:unnamed protein product [Paramecium pentaurelia]|uniref:Uncharacterized protein n=1 Tax=Paramecium pentaurelia TaxID=43138 RepID=A0A8S1TI85_9CILI|nr:unnamed protein product [Paramecium pentaurelia]